MLPSLASKMHYSSSLNVTVIILVIVGLLVVGNITREETATFFTYEGLEGERETRKKRTMKRSKRR